ncbi:MAG: hypothetical protein HKP55_13665 [Gammaproteobacteria bacterium]|nr:hypothetical protein [Gammaproteobacteria bacterium]
MMLDASGIVHIQDDLFLAAEDETDILRFFKLDDKAGILKATEEILHFGSKESDFESMAFDPHTRNFYCTGSFSSDYSQRLISFQLSDNKVIDKTELNYNARQLIPADVDIEAMTTWQSSLFMGYRKPSYNDKALAVIFNPDNNTYLLTNFDLGGRTFRDITRINDNNYLILAGPEKGKHYDLLPPRIFWWNGNIFSPELKQCEINLDGYRAEGIADRMNSDGSIDVLIGTDESKIKNADCFQVLLLKYKNLNEIISADPESLLLKVLL